MTCFGAVHFVYVHKNVIDQNVILKPHISLPSTALGIKLTARKSLSSPCNRFFSSTLLSLYLSPSFEEYEWNTRISPSIALSSLEPILQHCGYLKKGIGQSMTVYKLYGQLDFTVEVNPLLVPVYLNTFFCVDYCKLYAKATGASSLFISSRSK